MSLEQMREFVTIADEGSFSKAAVRLNVTQPALSKHIAAFERELGVRLLERGGGQTTLTLAGRALYDDAQGALQAYDLALEHLAQFRRQSPMTLTVQSFAGYPPSDDLLAVLDAEVRRERMPLEVVRRDITQRSALDEVRDGESDLCLVSHLDSADTHGLETEPLVRDYFVAIVRDDHPLAARDQISMADVGSEVVWTYRSAGVRTYFGSMEEMLLRHGARPRFMPMSWTNARDLYSSFAYFEGGMHVNLNSVVRHSLPLAMRGYKVLRFTDADATLMMYAHWRSGDANPAVARAVDILRSAAQRLGDDAYRG